MEFISFKVTAHNYSSIKSVNVKLLFFNMFPWGQNDIIKLVKAAKVAKPSQSSNSFKIMGSYWKAG